MTQFIIHIGPHKTGTGYLQEAFAATRRPLAERGLLYPPIWGERHHDELPGRLVLGDPRLEDQFTELRECGYPCVLLSHPGLIDLPAAGVEDPRRLTRRSNPVRIVFYVRSWAALLLSHWKQAVLSGGTQTLREFLLEWMADPAASPIVNFAPALRNYAAQFGPFAIDIVAYDSVVAEAGDLFRHFAARFLDWPDAPALDLPHANVSPDASTIEVVRALHAIARARLGHAPSRGQALALADCYLRRSETFAAPALRRALATYAAAAPLDELDVHLAQLHRDLFNEFREAVVEPRLPGMFFQARRVESPTSSAIFCWRRG